MVQLLGASQLSGHTALIDQAPWIVFKARSWLENYLQPNMTIFEYGSGGSTIYFAKRAKKIISVEHCKSWYKKVSNAIKENGISNSEYFLREPEKIISKKIPSYGYKSYTSTVCSSMNFEKYVKSIEKYPDKSFDLIFIDGRARSSCVFHAINKIRPGGCLMLDNSERAEYNGAKTLLNSYNKIDFYGLGPYRPYRLYRNFFWQTSVWQLR